MTIDPVTHGATFAEDILSHHGVKGQKWGVRRKSKKTSSDFKKTVPHRGKRPSELSNKQLKAVNERISLEQSYSRLNPKKTQRGKASAQNILATAGIAVAAYNTLNSPAAKALISRGKSLIR